MTPRRVTTTRVAFVALGVVALAAALAPLIAPYAPDAIDLANRRAAPSWGHWFGTDELGRDVLSRVLFGARVSLAVGLLSAAVTALIGVTIGATGGYGRSGSDAILMRFTDAMLAIPRLPLLMVLAAILEPSLIVLILIVGLVGWMETARVVRSETLSLKDRAFIHAARAGGARASHVVARHIVPNIAPAATVATTLAVGRGILLESAMSFFGVGVQPPQASWGNMLYQAQTTMSTEPWVAVFPGMFILLTVLAVNVLGQELATS